MLVFASAEYSYGNCPHHCCCCLSLNVGRSSNNTLHSKSIRAMQANNRQTKIIAQLSVPMRPFPSQNLSHHNKGGARLAGSLMS